ncbi:MAG: hypothetical protein GY713_12785 [Actinomycetia bacterium]|nr:hypothetical protein [Actinomycetes bacterium]MCP3911818.1 hypothetical protein [Actinomycetes bacterium]
MRTRAFWLISLGHASALLVVGASMAHLALPAMMVWLFVLLHGLAGAAATGGGWFWFATAPVPPDET